MKLATLRDGTRDGQLAVVSRDLSTAHFAADIAPTLQRALDDWGFAAPLLEDLSLTLNLGKARHAFPFDPSRCMAPLPRACQWLDASSYLPHIERLLGARGVAIPDFARLGPLMYQGGSDDMLGPCEPARFASEDWGIDFEAELAVIVDDVPAGAPPGACAERIRLLTLVNDWSLRALITDELSKGFGFLLSKPSSAFAPVAVTPDELGPDWADGRVQRPVLVHWNGRLVGQAHAGEDALYGFPELLAHAASTRTLRAGTVLGAGTVSNRDAGRGWCCIAEARALEAVRDGSAVTPWMRYGDTVRIEVLGRDGTSVFGAIEQAVAPPVLAAA